MAVATGDIPRLHKLVQQGLRDGASIGAITTKIEAGLAGAYQARGYDETDLDISLMVLRLGGRKLLYALNHQFAIPSLRALRAAHAFTELTPSFGTPCINTIISNIHSIFLPKVPSLDPIRPYCTGMSIFWDEISQEEVACYFPKQDYVGGLCREHSTSVNLQLSTFDDAVAIAHSLAEGVVHYGKESSVIAMGSFGKGLRGAFPVLVSSTCKQETPIESGVLLQKVITAWQEAGKKYFGPIWSFASDGDAGRRSMIYNLFMKQPINATHRLFKFVGTLPGLNLMVGEGDITADIDWKHEVKSK